MTTIESYRHICAKNIVFHIRINGLRGSDLASELLASAEQNLDSEEYQSLLDAIVLEHGNLKEPDADFDEWMKYVRKGVVLFSNDLILG